MSNKKTNVKSPPQQSIMPPSIPIDIDYGKIAEAIIKAQEQLKPEPKEISCSNKIGFFEAVLLILRGKKDTEDKLTTGLMAIPLALLFKSISIIGFISLPVSIYVIVKYIITMTWTISLTLIGNISTVILFVLLLLTIFIFSVLIWGVSNEIEKSQDKYFITAIFSGFVSLVALVVSLIALKG